MLADIPGAGLLAQLLDDVVEPVQSGLRMAPLAVDLEQESFGDAIGSRRAQSAPVSMWIVRSGRLPWRSTPTSARSRIDSRHATVWWIVPFVIGTSRSA